MRIAAVLLAAGTTALGIAALPATAAPKPQVMTFLSIQTSQHESAAKVVIHDNDVWEKKQIGHDVLTCLKKPKVLSCVIVISFAKGTLSATFETDIKASSRTGNGQISGGTGAYAGAHGTFAYKNLNEADTRTQLTLAIK